MQNSFCLMGQVDMRVWLSLSNLSLAFFVILGRLKEHPNNSQILPQSIFKVSSEAQCAMETFQVKRLEKSQQSSASHLQLPSTVQAKDKPCLMKKKIQKNLIYLTEGDKEGKKSDRTDRKEIQTD